MNKSALSMLLCCLLLPLSAMADVVDLPALKGKVVYLDFWASWCVPCRQSFPWMADLERSLGKEGLVVVAVNLDQMRNDADQFLAEFKPPFRVAFDPQGGMAERFHVRGMPTSVLIGRDGQPKLVHQGFRIKDRESLEQQIRAALR